MNSFNLLSGLKQSTPPSPQTPSFANNSPTQPDTHSGASAGLPRHDLHPSLLTPYAGDMEKEEAYSSSTYRDGPRNAEEPMDEKSALLGLPAGEDKPVSGYMTWMLTRQIPGAIAGAVRFVIAATLAPGKYLVACFYDDAGLFSPLEPVYRVARTFIPKRRRPQVVPADTTDHSNTERSSRASDSGKSRRRKSNRRSPSSASASALTSDSEFDSERPSTRDGEFDAPSHHTRSRSITTAADEIAPAKRSIRIKLHNEDALQERRRKNQARKKIPSETLSPEEAAAALKSPTSPATASKLTKFPRAPMPPRPLVPKRQPSYSTVGAQLGPNQKTLIIDLDETLIHSQVKGGRFTTGHMVEVKLQQPIGVGGVTLGPSVPILYYVNKRPHCDEFLRKVSKWYNLVIFTASMQEYADPVIDWLEAECKYFTARYYRQHCTARAASYIKDLSQVEPDLSKVMILDNSPICYAFQPDNAIPIDGWTSDPTDNDLLYLIPFLEALQHVTDVRALLGLRLGQPEAV